MTRSYIAATLPQYRCRDCDSLLDIDELGENDGGYSVCPHCGTDEPGYEHDRPARWWSVGLYEIGRAYGGPEEGGWWYDVGTLTDPWTVRGFDTEVAAREYLDHLWAHRRELCGDYRIEPRGFTESLPVLGFPARRPHYS